MKNVIEYFKDKIRLGGDWTYLIWKIRWGLRGKKLKKNPNKYLESVCRKRFGEQFNIENPRTFNEKLQWLKLYWYNPLVTQCCDKYRVREYLEENGMGHLLNELIGVYDSVDDINIDELPNRFIAKVTHGSHMNVLCKNKSKFNWKKEKGRLNMWLKLNYSYNGGEWGYHDIRPRIIVEKYLIDPNENDLMDFRVFCFNGEPREIHVDYSVQSNYSRIIYDTQWNEVDFIYARPNVIGNKIKKPEKLDEMLTCASKLAKPFPFVRVDFYSIGSKLYFAELTFWLSSGLGKFIPESYDLVYGKRIILPPKGDHVCY
jgi:hypothetical protein